MSVFSIFFLTLSFTIHHQTIKHKRVIIILILITIFVTVCFLAFHHLALESFQIVVLHIFKLFISLLFDRLFSVPFVCIIVYFYYNYYFVKLRDVTMNWGESLWNVCISVIWATFFLLCFDNRDFNFSTQIHWVIYF